jgi:hypothetical protein
VYQIDDRLSQNRAGFVSRVVEVDIVEDVKLSSCQVR